MPFERKKLLHVVNIDFIMFIFLPFTHKGKGFFKVQVDFQDVQWGVTEVTGKLEIRLERFLDLTGYTTGMDQGSDGGQSVLHFRKIEPVHVIIHKFNQDQGLEALIVEPFKLPSCAGWDRCAVLSQVKF